MVNSSKWDLVVLTTLDTSQKAAFEMQMQDKLLKSRLDQYACAFRVYADPDVGLKLGSGGAILFALHHLQLDFGDEIFSKRILFIAVGGYSKRQPNGSALGKLFTLVPASGRKIMTLFDLKLSIYEKFPKGLPCGMFIVASDTLEYYDEKCIGDEIAPDLFNVNGFTALAYVSPIEIALTHGVFVVENTSKDVRCRNDDIYMLKVRKILQKPTIEELSKENALLNCKETGTMTAYTDSVYFMGCDVMKKLISFIREENFQLDSEICAYSDFLRPLGPDNSAVYAKSTSQLKLFQLLRNSPLRVVNFRNSKFYHLGTFPELLEHYCNDRARFYSDFKLTKQCGLKIVNCNHNGSVTNNTSLKSIDSCAMVAFLGQNSFTPDNCILEFCRFDAGLVIQAPNCILSNCCYNMLPVRIDHPVFMSTIPILDPINFGQRNFVTVVFETFTDFKTCCKDDSDPLYFCRSSQQLATLLGYSSVDKLFYPPGNRCVWNARIFPAESSMQKSFEISLQLLNVMTEKSAENNQSSNWSIFHGRQLYSMHDVILMKNVEEMMRYRRDMVLRIATLENL